MTFLAGLLYVGGAGIAHLYRFDIPAFEFGETVLVQV
jgi:hypothetical protein